MEDIFSIIFVVMLILLFILVVKMSLDSDHSDVPTLIKVLTKEDKVLYPIGILMLGYQIFKSGKWWLSPETTNYILIFFYILNILAIFIYKLLWKKIENEEKFVYFLCFNILFTPFFTVTFLVMMLFQI